MQQLFCCGSATHEPYGLRCIEMNIVEKTNNAITTCLNQIQKYQPLTQEQYLPIFKKLNRNNIINSIMVASIPVAFIICVIATTLTMTVNSSIFSPYNKIFAIAAFIIFVISFFIIKILNNNSNKIIEHNNIRDLDIDNFEEISIESYQLIKNLCDNFLDYRIKTQEIINFRNGKILSFDYYNLYTSELNDLLEISKKIQKNKEINKEVIQHILNNEETK